MGATLGAALGHALGVPVEVMAAVGYVAVFAGAANTPLTCTIMGAELFGAGALVPIAIACVVSFVFSSHRSIYDTQRVAVTKGGVALPHARLIDGLRRRHRPGPMMTRMMTRPLTRPVVRPVVRPAERG